ncbi:hypothetical protein BH11PSE11_BH11PSE11_06260 [soil metagenome]
MSRFDAIKAIVAMAACAIGLASGGSAWAQKPVLIAPAWKAGDEYTYVLEKSRRRAGQDPVGSQSELLLKVVSASASGYEVEVSQPRFVMPDAMEAVTDPDDGILLAEVLETLSGMRFEITTDRRGALQSLKNWRTIRQHALKFIQVINKGMSASIPAEARKHLEQLYANEESTRQTALRDIEILFAPYGDELVPNQKLVSEGNVPSAVFGPLAVKDSYKLNLNAPKKGVMTETFERSFDSAQIAQVIDRYLAKVVGEVPPREQLLKQLSIRDRALYEIDMRSNVLISAERVRESGINNGEAAETISLRARRK